MNRTAQVQAWAHNLKQFSSYLSKTAKLLFIYIQNWLFSVFFSCLQLTFDLVSFAVVQSTLFWLCLSLRGVETICWLLAFHSLLSDSFRSINSSEGCVSNGLTLCLAALPDVRKPNARSVATSVLFLQWLGFVSWNNSLLKNRPEPVSVSTKNWKHSCIRLHYKYVLSQYDGWTNMLFWPL